MLYYGCSLYQRMDALLSELEAQMKAVDAELQLLDARVQEAQSELRLADGHFTATLLGMGGATDGELNRFVREHIAASLAANYRIRDLELETLTFVEEKGEIIKKMAATKELLFCEEQRRLHGDDVFDRTLEG